MVGKKKVGLLVLAYVAVVLVGGVLTNVLDPGKSTPTPEDMVFRWAEPTVGAPVVYYEVEIRQGGSESDDVTSVTTSANKIVIPVTNFLVKYEIRTRGVDARGRRGLWSTWSDEYDRGLPEADF